jgi:hypothetical protein
MCLDILLKLFQKPSYQLPYLPIKADYSQTVATVYLDSVFNDWFNKYFVPADNYNYWRNIIHIEVFDEWAQWVYDKFPGQEVFLNLATALTYNDTDGRHLLVKAPFLNIGVLAHEQAHNSYALLSTDDKNGFARDYVSYYETDEAIKYLYKNKIVTTYDPVEIHAEIYRYLGKYMPEGLRKYFPKLM